MYKNIYQYEMPCVTCQTWNLRKVRPPQWETDAPSYPFAKLGLDVSWSYPKTISGKKDIIWFVDWYSGWTVAFAVHDKTLETVVHLLLEEILQRHITPLQKVTDNGTENINMVMKHTLKEMNISHVITPYYLPQGNSQVEYSHCTLHMSYHRK